MTEHWFYCSQVQRGEVTLDEAEARHATQSLRLKVGDRLTVFDGCGHVGRASIAADDAIEAAQRGRRRRPTISVFVEQVHNVEPPACTLTLIVPGCKGVRLHWLIEKCTELGVGRVVLAEFERSVVHTGPQHVEKLHRTAIEACKQCRRAWLPTIEAGDTLRETAAQSNGSPLLVAQPTEDALPLTAWLAEHKPPTRALTIVIGPEGGLTPTELEVLQSSGGQFVRLAQHILRVETAAIAAAASWATHALPVSAP